MREKTYNANLVPKTSGTYDLGSSARPWGTIYTNTIHSLSDSILGVASGNVGDVSIGNEQCGLLLDEVNHKLKFRVRYSNGTYKTGEVALV